VGLTRRWFAAELDWRRGRERRAVKGLRTALTTAEAMRVPFEAAALRVALAQRLGAQSPERRALLDAAVEAFAQLGASHELASAQELRQPP
jgi:hypothetical protein